MNKIISKEINMKQFLIICGAIGIAVIGSVLVTFPIAAIFGAMGYFYIIESIEPDE
jgi:hypothetical protein